MASPAGKVRLDLEIEVDEDPISGSVGAAGQKTCHFVGWLAFVNALDEAVRNAGAGSHDEG